MMMAIAEPCTWPNVSRRDNTAESHMIAPTRANAVTRPLWANTLLNISSMTDSSGSNVFLFDEFVVVHGRQRARVASCAADCGNDTSAQQRSADGRQQRHRPAFEGDDDVLLCGHGHDHWDVHRAPETDTGLGFLGQQPALVQIDAKGNQHEHGDADPSDIGFDADHAPEQVAQKQSSKMAE